MPADGRTPAIHFWTNHPEAGEPWNPDEEPLRHADAFGHAFLELYWRMKAEGMPVTIGPAVPRESTALVAILHELIGWHPSAPAQPVALLAREALRCRPVPRIVVIRVDVPLQVAAPRIASLTIMPTRASVERDDQLALPMLPNRGLVPRDAARADQLRTVAIKAYSYNVPSWVDARFHDALADLGFVLRIDTEQDGRWGDFRDVDVVLCTHDTANLTDERSKPPTKLVNAWVAGAIPVCGPFTAYRELGENGSDMLVCDGTAAGYLAALAQLRESPETVAVLRAGIARRAPEFAAAAVTAEFVDAISRATPARRAALTAEVIRGGIHRLKAGLRS